MVVAGLQTEGIFRVGGSVSDKDRLFRVLLIHGTLKSLRTDQA